MFCMPDETEAPRFAVVSGNARGLRKAVSFTVRGRHKVVNGGRSVGVGCHVSPGVGHDGAALGGARPLRAVQASGDRKATRSPRPVFGLPDDNLESLHIGQHQGMDCCWDGSVDDGSSSWRTRF